MDVDRHSKEGRGGRVVFMGIMAVVLIGISVAVIRFIQQAESAGPAGPGSMPSGMPPAAVYVTPLLQQLTQEEAVVTGSLKAAERADVASRESGGIISVLVDEADEVKKGEVLVELDARKVTAAIAELESRLKASMSSQKRAEAEAERAEKDLEMKKALLADAAVSKSDFLDAEKASRVANALLSESKDFIQEVVSQIDVLKVQLGDLVVKAPFSGVVISRDVEPGEWVSAGGKLFAIAAMDEVEAWLRVPTRYLAGDRSNAEVKVRQSATGQMFVPKSVELVPEVEPLSQLFTLVASIENSSRKLIPGESVTGIVSVGSKKTYHKVPVDAVVESAMGTAIYSVAGKDGEPMPIANRISVEVAFERDGFAFIDPERFSVPEEVMIVVEGNERLMPGQPLMIQEREAAP